TVQGGYPLAYRGGASLDAQRRYIEEPSTQPLNQPRRPYEEPIPSQTRGPLQLPGSVPPTEEMIIGDDEGTGVLDQDGMDQGVSAISPQRDPFAFSSGRTPPRR
ncbi:MAG: hypothetical protein ACK4VM_20210, partial [Bosea sp. (in: a-proteobacteria)]